MNSDNRKLLKNSAKILKLIDDIEKTLKELEKERMITATDYGRMFRQRALANLVIVLEPNAPAYVKQMIKDIFDPTFTDDDKEVAEEHWRAKDINYEQTGDFKFLIYSNELYGACFLSKCFIALQMQQTEFAYIRHIDFSYERDYDKRDGEVCGEYFYL